MTRMAQKPNFIRQRREELKITQEDLVARLQTEGITISRPTLSNWERGEAKPPLDDPDFRRALAKGLRMSVRDLLDESGYEVEKNVHSDEAERAAYIIDHLPREKRRLVLGILEQFLETN